MTRIVYRDDKHELEFFFSRLISNKRFFFFFYEWRNSLVSCVREALDIFCWFFQGSDSSKFRFLFFLTWIFEHKQSLQWCCTDFVNNSQRWEKIRLSFLLLSIHVLPSHSLSTCFPVLYHRGKVRQETFMTHLTGMDCYGEVGTAFFKV